MYFIIYLIHMNANTSKPNILSNFGVSEQPNYKIKFAFFHISVFYDFL